MRGPQRPKNLGSRVALLPGKFLRVRKVFARITEKYLVNCPNTVGHPDINLLFQVPLGVHLADILDLQLQCPDLSESFEALLCVDVNPGQPAAEARVRVAPEKLCENVK